MLLDLQERQCRFLLRLAGVRDRKVYIGPESVCVSLTNRCELSCKYCRYHSLSGRVRSGVPKDISIRKFYAIVRDCVSLKVGEVQISGEGEPTKHPHFVNIMGFLEMQPIKVTVFTNGTFFPAVCRDVLKGDEAIVNLGAADRDTYYSVHGVDRFDRVLGNIRRLIRLRDQHKPLFKIRIAYVVNRLNASCTERASHFFDELGVDSFDPTLVIADGHDQGLVPDQWNRSLVRAGHPSPVCSRGWFNVIITLDGRVRSCFQPESWKMVKMGERSFKQVWLSAGFMRARKEGLAGGFFARFHECQQCMFFLENAEVSRMALKTGGWQ